MAHFGLNESGTQNESLTYALFCSIKIFTCGPIFQIELQQIPK